MKSKKFYGKDEKERIYKELEHCTCDNNKKTNTYPFFFKMKHQKVMLITLVPSFQAVYRQLASTRFFREIFLALCGANPSIPSGSLVSCFLEAFYWSHYHKCYVPRPKGEAVPYSDSIDHQCFNRYMMCEINALKPELILILGKPSIEKILGKDLGDEEILYENVNGIPTIAANFPKGPETEFIVIRKRLKRYIPWIDTKPVPEHMVSSVSKIKETIAVHAKFERDGLKQLWGRISETDAKLPDNIDKLWIEREVIPRWNSILFC